MTRLGYSARPAALILDEVEVAVVPGEAFGSPGYLRFSYALGDDDIHEGISRILEGIAYGIGRIGLGERPTV